MLRRLDVICNEDAGSSTFLGRKSTVLRSGPDESLVLPLALLVVICHAYDAVLALRALLELAPCGLELARERLARTEVRADVPDLEFRLGAGGRQGERVVW